MDVFGYNALLLLKNFYGRFIKYNYMLIYQLDAYVFRDELEYWCSQNYDFIGAPWITPQIITGDPVFGNRFGVVVGNGGFSLRKIDAFIRLYSSKIVCMAILSLLVTFFNILAQRSRLHIGLMAVRILFFPIKIVCDKIGIILDDAKHEDIVWAKIMLAKNGNVPSGFTSLQFAFELCADYLYELNNGKLPFGCHAWPEYYCWHLVWKKFIALET
jgi:hypothetical protein